MNLTIEVELEEDGRWIAEVIDLSGVLAYGHSQEDAIARVKALALRVVADQIEQGERSPKLNHLAFLAA
jgi:predicted RNase H-like HicB family nuclease